MKIINPSSLVSLIILISVSGFSAPISAEEVAFYYNKVDWTYLKKDAENARASKAFKQIAPKRLPKAKRNSELGKLIKKFRKLNRKIVKTNRADESATAKFVAQYSAIEARADSFANAGGPAEGKGACMKECADNFPGTGGGNGANRIACKLSCLVLGE